MKPNEYYIPQRFVDAVSVHLVMNVIDIPPLRPPVILGIHGPAGEGKTEQCRIIFDQMKVWAEWLFGDQFESEQAGEPVRLLKEKYKDASKFNLAVRRSYEGGPQFNHPCRLTVLFINDLDLRIGRSDRLIQQTINTQLVNALLMGIADTPNQIDGLTMSRVPIITTANNFGVIYKPLLRDGRAEKFEWKPRPEEKIKVVQHIFPELDEREIQKFVSEFTQLNGDMSSTKSINTDTSHNPDPGSGERTGFDLPISSFAMLRYHLYKAEVLKMIREVGLERILDYVLSGKHKQGLKSFRLTLESLRQATEELISNGVLLDHLEC